MARKKLEPKQQKELEKMVVEGFTPEDISKRFGIAVSSVHNYKRMLKERGVKIPDVRGKRPSNIAPAPVQTLTAAAPAKSSTTDDHMKIVINNVVFYISARAKSVSVDKHDLHVTF